MELDICSVTQNGKRTWSFFSQCVGLMADADLGVFLNCDLFSA
jgi:sphingosine kinase